MAERCRGGAGARCHLESIPRRDLGMSSRCADCSTPGVPGTGPLSRNGTGSYAKDSGQVPAEERA